jgi:hypothetical protein
MQKNYKILKELYLTNGSRPILTQQLFQKGFEFAAPTRKVKSPRNGYDIYLFQGFGYRIYNIDELQYMTIYKKEEINNF